MNSFTRILSRRRFIGASILGGLVAPFLKSERVEANSELGFPNINISYLHIPKNVSIAQPVGSWAKIGDIGTFEIKSWNSILEVTFQGRVKATGNGKTLFGISLHDHDDDFGGGIFEVLPEELMQNVNVHYTSYNQVVGVYSPGICNMSLWGYTDGPIGGAVWMNPTGSDGDRIYIKEYMPLGSTFLPLIQR